MADGEKVTHYLTARVGSTDLRRIKAIAVAEERTKSAVARRALQLGLAQLEAKAAKAKKKA